MPVAAQYVDHNLVQTDHMNADEHLFLRSACRRFGLWYSRPGNGISHPVHFARFGRPGDVIVGSDSHTPAAGAMGMLGFGAGGADVALAMAGEPLRLTMPRVRGVRLVGALPDFDTAGSTERLREVPRHPGLFSLLGYASRGLIWAPLCAELLAARLENEPLPLETNLVDALDPARFVLRARRSGRNPPMFAPD